MSVLIPVSHMKKKILKHAPEIENSYKELASHVNMTISIFC